MQWLVIMFSIMMIAAIACTTTTVEVPPGHVGKLQTKTGLQKDVLNVGLLKLPNRCAACDKVVLLEVADFPTQEDLKIFMPKDRLNIDLQTFGTYFIDRDRINEVYARITPKPLRRDSISGTEEGELLKTSRVTKISMESVYNTYVRPVVRDVTRSFLVKFTIDELMSNRAELGDELFNLVEKELEVTPVKVRLFGFADIQPPGVVVSANEQRKEREIAIDRAQANKLVALTEAEADLEVARKQQEVDLIEAQTQVLVQEVLNGAVGEAFIIQRYLKFLNKLADSNNVVFFPVELLQGGNEALSFRIFSQDLITNLNESFSNSPID